MHIFIMIIYSFYSSNMMTACDNKILENTTSNMVYQEVSIFTIVKKTLSILCSRVVQTRLLISS